MFRFGRLRVTYLHRCCNMSRMRAIWAQAKSAYVEVSLFSRRPTLVTSLVSLGCGVKVGYAIGLVCLPWSGSGPLRVFQEIKR